MSARHPTRILLVDDHPLLREGTAQRLTHEPDFVVCGEVGTVAEALAAVERHRPDLVIVDISLPGRDGIELIKDLRARQPRLRLVVFTLHDEALYAERALRAGAHGYVMKSEPPDHLIRAVRRVLAGEIAVGQRTSDRLLHRLARTGPAHPLATLSDRELEIYRLLGQGFSRREIAGKLRLSVKTVETHRARLREKLGLRSAADLLRHAIQFAAVGR